MLAGTPSQELKDFAASKFYCPHAIIHGNYAITVSLAPSLYLLFTCATTETLGISGKRFYRSDALPVAQPTVSKHRTQP